jgi:RimJ/RimL family protein N-acetyltransferase
MEQSLSTKPFLEGVSIILRPLTNADAEGNYTSWLNDPEVCAHNSHHVFPYSKSETIAYIERVRASTSDLVLAIESTDTHQHIGNIALQKIDWIARNAEYAILLGERAYWGKGVAYEASQLIIAHGFNALHLHRIYCGTSNSNKAMQKLADKLGFRKEGKRVDAHWKDGSYTDVIEYGLLASYIPHN